MRIERNIKKRTKKNNFQKTTALLLAMILCTATFYLGKVTVQGVAGNHVIYEVDWLTEESAKIKLSWSDTNETSKLMISGWSVEDQIITVYYQTGAKATEGFEQRTLMGNDIRFDQYILLRPAEQEVQKDEFTDLPEEKESLFSIRHLYYLGVLNGYTDETIRPEGKVTRAEFAKMLYLGAQFEPVEVKNQSFSDVALTHWASPYIYTLATKNIVNGKGKGIYDPSGTITIGEVLTILSRSFEVYSEVENYTDTLENHWSNEYFVDLVESGIIQRSDSFYKPYTPNRTATREECAILLSRILRSYYQVRQ
ncbi:MAG: S-layer homology domain-containing protein [Vallitaleaceae bacterium]|nr:S-layer homology domain-containing protein [Vallitaleaceae bacterium]